MYTVIIYIYIHEFGPLKDEFQPAKDIVPQVPIPGILWFYIQEFIQLILQVRILSFFCVERFLPSHSERFRVRHFFFGT